MIRLNAAGGREPYIYSLNRGNSYDTVNVFSGLSAGYYNAIIKDSNGCEMEIKNLHITEPDELTLVSTKTRAVACSSVQNGEIAVDVN